MRFGIDKNGLEMIAEYAKSLNLEAVLRLEKDQLVLKQFDTARARAIVLEYPITIVEGEPVTFAVKTDWLSDKVKLLKSKEVVCEVTDTALIIRQERTIKDVRMLQKYDLVLLSMEDETVKETTFDEEPAIECEAFCELPDVSLLAEAIVAMDTDSFYISASEEQLTLESETDYQNPASTITLFTPSIIKNEKNRTRQDRKQIAGFLNTLRGTTITTVAFSEDSVLVVESTGKDIRIKLYSAAIVE